MGVGGRSLSTCPGRHTRAGTLISIPLAAVVCTVTVVPLMSGTAMPVMGMAGTDVGGKGVPDWPAN